MTESDLGLSMLMNCCLSERYEPSHCKTVSVMLISDKWNNSTEWQTVSFTLHFTFMHLADAFIQSDLQCIQAIHLYCQYACSLGIEPTTFALLTQCSNH